MVTQRWLHCLSKGSFVHSLQSFPGYVLIHWEKVSSPLEMVATCWGCDAILPTECLTTQEYHVELDDPSEEDSLAHSLEDAIAPIYMCGDYCSLECMRTSQALALRKTGY